MNVAGPFDDLGGHIDASKTAMQGGFDSLSDGDVRGAAHGLIDAATAMATTPIDTTLHAIEDLFTDEEEGFLASPQALSIDAKNGPRAGGLWWTLANSKKTAPLLKALGKASSNPFARVPLALAALAPFIKAVIVGQLRHAKADGWPAVGFKNGDDYRSELEASQLAMLVAAATGRVVGCPSTRGSPCLGAGEKYSWGYATPERERARALWYLLFAGAEFEALPHFPDTLLGRTLAGAEKEAKNAPPPPPPPPGKKRLKFRVPPKRIRFSPPASEVKAVRAALKEVQSSPAMAKHALELRLLLAESSSGVFSSSSTRALLIVGGVVWLARR